VGVGRPAEMSEFFFDSEALKLYAQLYDATLRQRTVRSTDALTADSLILS